MINNAVASILIVFGLALFSGCASMHIWSDHERSAESKMAAIEKNTGDGLITGALTPDQVQIFLTTLKEIRPDYEELRNKVIYQERWNSLHVRLDVLGNEINRTVEPTTRIETPMNMDRIPTLQRDIDDGRISGGLPVREEQEFQARLDSIRRDYLMMSEGGRPISCEERVDVSLRLDSLAREMKKYR